MCDSAIHSIAGAAGGIIAMSATYPLVYISTRAALETKREQKSTFRTVVDSIERDGVSSLYDGLRASLLGIAVTNGVYYYFYEHSRGIILRLRSGSKALTTLESMLIGLIAGSAATIISNPIWVVQTSQTAQTTPDGQPQRLGFLDTVRSILTKDGPSAFFRGIGPALVLVVNPIIQYTVFEQLKNHLIKMRNARVRGVPAVLSDWDFLFLGAVSKLVATGFTYPYIVVKSRMQAGSANASTYKSSLDGLFAILLNEGIGGWYKGVCSKLLQSVLTAAILFAGQRRVFELTKSLIQTFSEQRKSLK